VEEALPTVTSLNAVDFGMTPNTGTNQTSNFQSAINAAQSQNLPLFIPPGGYKITTVNITAQVEIYSCQRGADILGFSQSPQINIGGSSWINYVKISDLTIDAQNQSFTGSPSDAGLIQATNVSTLIIENCVINNSAIHGIYLTSLAGQAQLVGNDVGAAAKFGIFLENSAALIENNSVINSGNGGIVINESSETGNNSIVKGNTVGQTGATLGGTGQWGNAISVFMSDYVMVANNTIYGSAFSAIRYNQSSFGQILGNNCYGSTATGIVIEAPGPEGSYSGGIIANNVIDTAGEGIGVGNTPGHRVIISNNQVSNIVVQEVVPGLMSTGRGIGGESDILVSGNQLENIADWAIALLPFTISGTWTIAQAENNMIKTCAGGIAFLQSNSDTAIFIGGNTIYNYTETTQYAAIVACTYDGGTGVISRVSGSTDLGNATSSGFSNVKLLLNYSFT
jgi:uncharacterized secreted repeat protein (TIGR03808 family)